ncbi:MAG: response regulator transcription factor [Acidimicrobiales bacterium]
MTIRVVVAEDSLLMRQGIEALLSSVDDIEVVELVDDLPSLLEAVDRAVPDVVLTDIRMPPTGTDEGIRGASELRGRHPGIGVVVLSQYVEPTYALELFDQGSAGRAYLLKERIADADQLVRAIREVAVGGSVIDPIVVESLVKVRAKVPDSPLGRLTPRELEVLEEIAQGKNNAAVAGALGLSERAVEKHINSLFSKLDLSHEPNLHRRVTAVLLYLSNKDGSPAGGG